MPTLRFGSYMIWFNNGIGNIFYKILAKDAE